MNVIMGMQADLMVVGVAAGALSFHPPQTPSGIERAEDDQRPGGDLTAE
jgi:hypothetical protein